MVLYSVFSMMKFLSVSSALESRKADIIMNVARIISSKLVNSVILFISDASVNRNGSAGGVVAINAAFQPECGWAMKIKETNVLRAELSAIYNACLFANGPSLFLSDCQQAVELLHCEDSSPAHCDLSLQIRCLAREKDWFFLFLPRRFTCIADKIARDSLVGKLKFGWVSEFDADLLLPLRHLLGFV